MMSKDCIGIVCKAGMIAFISAFAALQHLHAQNLVPGNASNYQVSAATERITMIASTSQVLTMDFDVPYVVVGNQEILKANPVSPNQILVTAVKPGITAISLTDPQNNPHTIEVHVIGDVRALQATLEELFPESDIHARALVQGVVLTGHVSRADEVAKVVEISREYFPNTINYLSVGGSQKVMLKVKVVEVSRTKLRKLGIDWSALTSNFNLISNVSGLINPSGTGGIGTVRASVSSGGDNFNLLIDTLEQNNLAKVLAEPTLTAMSGRPAGFHSGGTVPVPINSGLGVQSVQYQPFGTRLDFVPIVLGNGRIRLEVRPEVSDIAGDLRDPVTGAPGFRIRTVDTGVEMQVGHTLALAGLIQNRVDSQERGMPVLKDMPWIGAAFRRVEETFNEVELVILITPYFINEVDDCILPLPPGRGTVLPNDNELYNKGYREVPRCGNQFDLGPMNGSVGTTYTQPEYQSLPAVEPAAQPAPIQPVPGLQTQLEQEQDDLPLSGQYGQSATQSYKQVANPVSYQAPEPNASSTTSSQRRTEAYSAEMPAEKPKQTRSFPRPTLFGINE
jgi:pilus assembly protein CpaC